MIGRFVRGLSVSKVASVFDEISQETKSIKAKSALSPALGSRKPYIKVIKITLFDQKHRKTNFFLKTRIEKRCYAIEIVLFNGSEMTTIVRTIKIFFDFVDKLSL